MAFRIRVGPKEARASQKLFGTDGVRGVANVHPMTAEVAMQLGRALAYLIRNGSHRHRVVIGKDTRLSGYMLESALAAGITSMGVDVAMVGPLPTPAIANITTSMRADAGAVISASHNPYQDNGIKFFWRDGFKLPDETEGQIEDLIANNTIDHLRPTATKIGSAIRLEDARGRYIVFLKNTFPRDLTLEGLTIAVDCANGAMYRAAPLALSEAGADVTVMYCDPDGVNINAGCGSTHIGALQQVVRADGYDLGLAFDGDGDRVLAVDASGELVDGDFIIAILAKHLKGLGRLRGDTVVTTVMTNLGFHQAMAREGIEVVVTDVGDRYVIAEMLKGDFLLGGEQSGHIINRDVSTTGDGLATALLLLQALGQMGVPLAEAATVMRRLPQKLVNVRVRDRDELAGAAEVWAAVDAESRRLDGSGRVLVRTSGTEPLVRVMAEAPTAEEVDATCDRIVAVVEKHLA